jgi:hypothetical protein
MEFEVVKFRQMNEREYVLLCSLPNNSITPWVTWRSDTPKGNDRYWGHYFRNYAEAREDYELR